MTARPPVELEIDFRQFARSPRDPQEFLSFWDELSEHHVVILSGGMRLDGHPLAACDLHIPNCKCGQRASFWCAGPQCRRRAAWCEQHREQYPNSPEIIYCCDCYSEVFPTCARPGCKLTATNVCEYVKAGGNS